MHILAANCHWIYYVDFSGLFNISPGDNLSDFKKTHGLDCYLVDVYRLLYSKNTPCSYFNFFFIFRGQYFLMQKRCHGEQKITKVFRECFVRHVDFTMFRKHPKFPVDMEQEKDARFGIRAVYIYRFLYMYNVFLSARPFPFCIHSSLWISFSGFQIVDGF